jgi:hypothetical protein
MNKITKIWVLWLALCWLVVALNVKAATWDVKTEVSLKLTNGENSCELEDYKLGTKWVSLSNQTTDQVTHSVNCTFLNSNAARVQFDMSDLVNTWDTTKIIEDDNFSGSMAWVSVTWTLNATAATVAEFNIGNPHVVYVKNANTAWVWSGNLTIQGTIPGSTPAWTYTGSLDLTLQATQPQS